MARPVHLHHPRSILKGIRGDWRRPVYPLITLLVAAIAWEFLTRETDSLLVPTSIEIGSSLVQLLGSSRLWTAVLDSNAALVLGFMITLAAGIPLGLLLGRYRFAESLINPYLTILLTVPVAGFIPLLLATLGIGLEARVTVVVMFSIVVLVVNCRAGVREVDPSLIEMARAFGANELQIWRRILLPGSVPAVMTGVRVALGFAVTGMVVVELLLVAVGYGRLLLELQSQFDAGGLYALVVIILAQAVILISVVDRVARRAAPWSTDGRSRE